MRENKEDFEKVVGGEANENIHRNENKDETDEEWGGYGNG